MYAVREITQIPYEAIGKNLETVITPQSSTPYRKWKRKLHRIQKQKATVEDIIKNIRSL